MKFRFLFHREIRDTARRFIESPARSMKGRAMSSDFLNVDLPKTGFIRQKQLLTILPFSSATLWRAVKAGTFVAPVKLSERCTAWRVEDVRAWMQTRPAAMAD